jgi:hypothetical protein
VGRGAARSSAGQQERGGLVVAAPFFIRSAGVWQAPGASVTPTDGSRTQWRDANLASLLVDRLVESLQGMKVEVARQLIRNVRSARRELGRAKRLYREMDGHPEHPSWKILLAEKPKKETGSDEWWIALESPPFTPPELNDFAARGFVRRNRWTASGPETTERR